MKKRPIIALSFLYHTAITAAAIAEHKLVQKALQLSYIGSKKNSSSPRHLPTTDIEKSTFSLNAPTVTQWINHSQSFPTYIDTQHDPTKIGEVASMLNIISPDKSKQWNTIIALIEKYIKQKKDILKMALPTETKKIESLSAIGVSLGDIDTFQPFAQKKILQSKTILYVHGDFHGDMTTMRTILHHLLTENIIDEQFTLKNPNHYLAFLGDYTDRGYYGIEIIYTILRLLTANPEQVIAVRGNHEDHEINTKYGFTSELTSKFGDGKRKLITITQFYNYLPIVFYMGTTDKDHTANVIQLNHGGLEIGYYPQEFLDNSSEYAFLPKNLNYKKFMEDLCLKVKKQAETPADYYDKEDMNKIENITITYLENYKKDVCSLSKAYFILPHEKVTLTTSKSQFLWGDFDPLSHTSQALSLSYSAGRGYKFSKLIAQDILRLQSSNKIKIRGVIRGHQHTSNTNDPIMKGIMQNDGIFKLWRPDEIIDQKKDQGIFTYLKNVASKILYVDETKYKTLPKTMKRRMDDGIVWTCNVGMDSSYGMPFDKSFASLPKITMNIGDYKNWTMEVEPYPLLKKNK